MTTQDRLNELLDLAKSVYGVTNNNQLAPHIGVKPSTILRWQEGMIAPQARFILAILNEIYPESLPSHELVEA